MSKVEEFAQGWGDPLVPPFTEHAFHEQAKREGSLRGVGLNYVAHAPWLAAAVVKHGRIQPVFLDPQVTEMTILTVALDNACRHCYGAMRTYFRVLGYSDKAIERMENNAQIAELTPQQQAGLDFARAVARANPLPRDGVERLAAAGYSPAAAAEFAACAAAGVFSSRMMTSLAVPPDPFEEMSNDWKAKLFRPLFDSTYRIRRAPGPEPLPAAALAGPCGSLIARCEGSQLGPLISELVDGAINAAGWPRATKLLVFAVVARRIGCAFPEREARRLLIADGMTTEQIDSAIEHLNAPELTPVDLRLLDVARESVRTQGPPLQANVREFARGLTPVQIVEGLAVVSIANAVGRLAAVLGPDA